MGPNPLLGVTFLALAGLSSATNFIPFRQIKRWSWEVYWPVQAFAAWIAAPALAACLLVPNCCGLMQQAWQADPHSIWLAFLFGMAWGVGGMAFGLAIRYLGIGLGYAIALGCYILFTELAPVLHLGPTNQPSGHSAALGLALCVIGLVLSSAAGSRKETEMTLEVKLEAGEQDYHFPKGLAMAALAGLASIFLLLGLEAAAPLTGLTQSTLSAHAQPETWASLPALVIILCGGFATNLVWSAIMVLRSGLTKQFLGEPGVNPLRSVPTSGDTLVDFDPLDPSTYDRLAPSTLAANYLFALLAGAFWYLQLVFYFLGAGRIATHTSSPRLLQIAFTLLIAALWGLAVKEWRGTSAPTRLLSGLGLVLLVASALMLG